MTTMENTEELDNHQKKQRFQNLFKQILKFRFQMIQSLITWQLNKQMKNCSTIHYEWKFRIIINPPLFCCRNTVFVNLKWLLQCNFLSFTPPPFKHGLHYVLWIERSSIISIRKQVQ